jgi:hypothetical protein
MIGTLQKMKDDLLLRAIAGTPGRQKKSAARSRAADRIQLTAGSSLEEISRGEHE